MNLEYCVEGKIPLHELKPKIESNQILFPISASSEYVEVDGLSFGYPVDFGWITTVEYDFTVGALTEDTIALANSLKKPRGPSVGVHPMETYNFSEKEINAWRNGLDATWAELRYKDWLDNGLIDEGELKEDFITHELESYHSWPVAWRQACDAAHEARNTPVGQRHEVLENDVLKLYSDDNGDYFFSTPYHDYGKITKADKDSALEYIEEFENYIKALDAHNSKVIQLKDDLELLKSSL